MNPRVLVACVGNIFCSDDGFGPAVAQCLLAGEEQLPPGAHVVDYGIRGMHLAYDLLAEWDALVMVDALPDTGQPGVVSVLDVSSAGARAVGALDAHGMDPATVFANLAALGGQLPPQALLVGAQVADVEEGMGLTDVVQGAVEDGARTVCRLVRELLPAEVL